MPVPSQAILASKTPTIPSLPPVHRFSVRRIRPVNPHLVSPRLIPLSTHTKPADEYPSHHMGTSSGPSKQPSKEELDIIWQRVTEEMEAAQKNEVAAAAAAVTTSRKSSLFLNIERYEEEDLDNDFELIHASRAYSSYSSDSSEDQSLQDEEDSTTTTTTSQSSGTSSTVETDLDRLTHEALQDRQYECDADARLAFRAHRTQSYVHAMSSLAPSTMPSPWTGSPAEKAEIYGARQEMLQEELQSELEEERRAIRQAIQSRSQVYTTSSSTLSTSPSPWTSSLAEETEFHRAWQEMLQEKLQSELEEKRRAIRRAIQSQSHFHITSPPAPSTRPAPSTHSLAEEKLLFYLASINAKQDEMMAATQRNWPLCEHQQTLLRAQQALLKEQLELLDDQEVIIADQQALLADQKTLLSDQRTLLADQQALLTTQDAVIRILENQQGLNLGIDPPMLAPPPSTDSTGPCTTAPTGASTPSDTYNNHQAPESFSCCPPAPAAEKNHRAARLCIERWGPHVSEEEQSDIDDYDSDSDYANNYTDNYDYDFDYYFECSPFPAPEEEITTTPNEGEYIIPKTHANIANDDSSNANNNINNLLHPEKPVNPAPWVLATGCFFLLDCFLLYTSCPESWEWSCHHIFRRGSLGSQLLWVVLSYVYLLLIWDHLPQV